MNSILNLCLGFIIIILIADKVHGDVSTVSSAYNIRISNIKKDNSISSNPTHLHVCNKDRPYVWCLPSDYDKNVPPWKYRSLENLTLPWYYNFFFNLFEVQEIHEFDRTLTIDMYFGLLWIEPRLKINGTAIEKDIEGHTVEYNVGRFIGIPLNNLEDLWLPDLEIYGLRSFDTTSVLKPMASLKINKGKVLRYVVRVRTALSCQMDFHLYPFDSHECVFRAGSFYQHQDVVKCTSNFGHDPEHQRNLEYKIIITNLSSHEKTFEYIGVNWAYCGFKILLERTLTQILFQVYFTSALLVIVTWVSFILNPNNVPGRMGLLVTAFLTLINIFIGVRNSSPPSSGLNAISIFLVVCIGNVFAAFLEYACVLIIFGQGAASRHLGTSHADQLRIESTEQFEASTDRNKSKMQSCGKKLANNVIDCMSLILFPTTFAIFVTVYFKLYTQ